MRSTASYGQDYVFIMSNGGEQFFNDSHIGTHVEEIDMSDTAVGRRTAEAILKKLKEGSKTINAEVEEVKEPVEPDFLEEEQEEKGKHMYSTTFSGAKEWLKSSGKPDFSLDTIINEVEDWAEEHRQFIPKINKDYVWQHDVLYPAVLAMVNKLKVLVHGPTGSGKTDMYKNIAATINQPYYRLGGRADMESDSILGKPWIDNGSMHFEEGEFVKAYKAGYLLAIDEPWKMPPGIQMVFQRVYERDGILQLDDKPGTLADKQVIPHPSTYMVLCDNVVGTGDGADKYAATMIQDASTINRMDLVLFLSYLSPVEEVKFIRGKYKYVSAKIAKQVVQLAGLIRVGFNSGALSAGMSPRNIMAWMELAYKIKDYKQAFKWIMLERYAEDSEKEAVRGHYEVVFGEKL